MQEPNAQNLTSSPSPSPVGAAPANPLAPMGKVSGEAPVQTPEAKAQEDRVSGKLQLLVRREKQAIERERTAKSYEAQVKAREEALALREAKVQEFETLKQTNPRKALELLGLSYQDLTNVELNEGNITPEIQVKKVEEKLDGYLKSQAEKETAAAEEARKIAAAQEEQVTQDFNREIDSFITENAKVYELIQFEAAQRLIYDTIDEHYNRTMNKETGLGKIMTIKEAADKVEKYLRGKYEKARELDSVKSLWAPQPVKAPPAVKSEPTRYQSPRTLNNNMSATPARPVSRIRTDEERVMDAIAYAKTRGIAR